MERKRTIEKAEKIDFLHERTSESINQINQEILKLFSLTSHNPNNVPPYLKEDGTNLLHEIWYVRYNWSNFFVECWWE